MSYSEGWLVNAIKYLENSVFIYRNGQNISLPIENSQRLDRIGRYISSYADIAIESGAVLFTPFITESGQVIKDTLTAIKATEEKKEENKDSSGYGNLIEPINRGEGQEPIVFESKNIYEALNSLAKRIASGGYSFNIVYTTNVYDNMDLTVGK